MSANTLGSYFIEKMEGSNQANQLMETTTFEFSQCQYLPTLLQLQEALAHEYKEHKNNLYNN